MNKDMCLWYLMKYFLKIQYKPGVVVHTFNPSTWEAEAGGFLSLRPAWSTKWVPGQPELHRETMSRKTKQNKKKKNSVQMWNFKKWNSGLMRCLSE
jgi:hypothetical protein